MNKPVLFLIIILLIQIILTYFLTNTKRFSFQAYIMNFTIVYGIYLFYITRKIKFLFIPIIMKVKHIYWVNQL